MKANVALPLFFLGTEDAYFPKSLRYTQKDTSVRYKFLNSIYHKLNEDF